MTMLLEFMRRANLPALALLLACATIASCDSSKSNQAESRRIRSKLEAIPLDRKVQFTNDEWKYILTGRQYYVLRRGGTELPFTNAYWHTHEKGIYFCAACSNPLFNSDAKYDSGTGWPRFWQPIRGDAVSAASHSSFGGGNCSSIFPRFSIWPVQKQTGRRLRYFSSQFKCIRVCHFGLETLVAA